MADDDVPRCPGCSSPLCPDCRPSGRAPCGTTAAYRTHLRHGEPTCQACCDAEAVYRAQRRAGAR